MLCMPCTCQLYACQHYHVLQFLVYERTAASKGASANNWVLSEEELACHGNSLMQLILITWPLQSIMPKLGCEWRQHRPPANDGDALSLGNNTHIHTVITPTARACSIT